MGSTRNSVQAGEGEGGAAAQAQAAAPPLAPASRRWDGAIPSGFHFREKLMRSSSILAPLAAAMLAFGCTGAPLRIPTLPVQPNEDVIGPVTGKSTGLMLFQFIPIGQNDRFSDAYQRAMLSVSGATRLVDVTIQEDWFWAWILNGYSFELTGTAVRQK